MQPKRRRTYDENLFARIFYEAGKKVLRQQSTLLGGKGLLSTSKAGA